MKSIVEEQWIQETNAQALILFLNVSLYILAFQIKKLEAGRESDFSKNAESSPGSFQRQSGCGSVN